MESDKSHEAELGAIARRYARRESAGLARRYDALDPANLLILQERERRLVHWLRSSGLSRPSEITLLEVGCGSGSNLLHFLRLGFSPENLAGIDLLAERIAEARRRLPAAVALLEGNAAEPWYPLATFDVVFQSTVFSSILDESMQCRLARRMWDLARPGGGVLWYDFVFDNPANPDVRGVPVDRVRTLFPESDPTIWRLTLAPPIARFVTRIRPSLYGLLNTVPWLRTHVLGWFPKRRDSPLDDRRQVS